MKLTSKLLKKIIEEEAGKFGKMGDVESVKAEETDADEYADSLEKHIDYVKALKIEETRLRQRLVRIQEARAKAKKKILSTI